MDCRLASRSAIREVHDLVIASVMSHVRMMVATDAGFSITAGVFSAYLKCATKAYLSATGETAPICFFVSTKARISTAFKANVVRDLLDGSPRIEPIDFARVGRNLPDYGIAYYVDCDTVVYRWPPPSLEYLDRRTNKSTAAHRYIPVMYVAREKIEPSDILLLCFGALAISQVTGMIPETGRIIYAEGRRGKTVKISDHVVSAQQIIDAIRSNCGEGEPPRLVLNKHCATCDFQSRCRNISIERDDLSLLSALTPKERAKCEEKGIFTVTQLSYGYRPRRRKPVNSAAVLASQPAKHDHKLKALAIKKQIHVLGAPSIRIQGTPVFLDVEGVPDRNFYYLVGLRYLLHTEHVERSFWADARGDERANWQDFLRTLQAIHDPKIVHYGAYETRFLRHMKERYEQGAKGRDFVDRLVDSSVNLLNSIYGKLYFPTYSNSLKEIARFLGFKWTNPQASGGAALLIGSM
jgi:predicted RecB family nuclease